MPAKGTEIATRLRGGVVGRFGARTAPDETAIPACHFIPRTSSEQTDGQDTVIIGLTLIAPGGTDLLATDEIRRELDGTVWKVVGAPGDYRKGGRSRAVIAALERVMG